MKVDCCICGKEDLSTIEGDGGDECQLSNGDWVCSYECWEIAIDERSFDPIRDNFLAYLFDQGN